MFKTYAPFIFVVLTWMCWSNVFLYLNVSNCRNVFFFFFNPCINWNDFFFPFLLLFLVDTVLCVVPWRTKRGNCIENVYPSITLMNKSVDVDFLNILKSVFKEAVSLSLVFTQSPYSITSGQRECPVVPNCLWSLETSFTELHSPVALQKCLHPGLVL